MKKDAENTKRPLRIKTILTNIKKYFKQYCSSTSIHGFRYFGEDRSTFEKIWWAIIFSLCLPGCCIMIYKIYEKYETSPIIVTFATKETSLYKIPFPAVTICPEIKSERAKFNYTDVLLRKMNGQNLTDIEEKTLLYASLICSQDLFDDLITGNTNDTFTADFFSIVDEIKPDFTKMFFLCKFQDYTKNCAEILTPIFTDEGVCYSFNILDRDHIYSDAVHHYKEYHKVDNDSRFWNIENGYSENSDEEVYPRRAVFSGATNGLTVYMGTPNIGVDSMCRDVQGFKVVLHAPVRIPRLKQEYFRVPLDEAVVAAVHPIMITTSEAVKAFDANKLDCYFPSQIKLKYFRNYSQQNCLLECLTNITLNLCNCVNFCMPRNNSTNICGLNSRHCTKKAERLFQNEAYFNKFNDLSHSDVSYCGCLPLCTDLSYNVEISQTKWDWKQTAKLLINSEDFEKGERSTHLSSLTIYFKFNHFITSERHELYGPSDFVANFGGLLGLFTGFSILSLMEIIYFLTVRICCNVRLFGRWTGEN